MFKPTEPPKARCSVCGQDKPVTDFGPDKRRKCGHQPRCRECENTWRKERKAWRNLSPRTKEAKRRADKAWRGRNPDAVKLRNSEDRAARMAYLRDVMVERGCDDCGDKRLPVLEWHHRVPVKKGRIMRVSVAFSSSMIRGKKEMAKCDLVCANCHKLRHWQKKQGGDVPRGVSLSIVAQNFAQK